MTKRSRQQRPKVGVRVPSEGGHASWHLPNPHTERLLLVQIAVGELDEHLHAIADATYARLDLLDGQLAKALAMLQIGDSTSRLTAVRRRWIGA